MCILCTLMHVMCNNNDNEDDDYNHNKKKRFISMRFVHWRQVQGAEPYLKSSAFQQSPLCSSLYTSWSSGCNDMSPYVVRCPATRTTVSRPTVVPVRLLDDYHTFFSRSHQQHNADIVCRWRSIRSTCWNCLLWMRLQCLMKGSRVIA